MIPHPRKGDAPGDLDDRLRTLLPQEYQDSYEDVQPTPMGSAELKFAADGTVAWDEIWGSFCDLAMAGGPPHKGALLQPGTVADIDSRPERYEEIVAEICRGITLATELPARQSPVPGWVRVSCYSETMAAWLLRAITMENVAVRLDGMALDLPAAPGFRLEKEIKNVITVIAKTCHYWLGHVPTTQKQAIAILFASMNTEAPLIEPEFWSDGPQGPEYRQLVDRVSEAIRRDTGMVPSAHQYRGWLGVTCPSVHAAIWLMRAMVPCNVLSRREGTAMFVPINSLSDPDGQTVVKSLARVHRLAVERRIYLSGSSP